MTAAGRDGLPDIALSGSCDPDYTQSIGFVLLNRSGRPCTVPDLRGRRLGAVTDVLFDGGCRLRYAGYRASGTQRRGAVIGQRPAPGAVLPLDAPVDVVVSRGA